MQRRVGALMAARLEALPAAAGKTIIVQPGNRASSEHDKRRGTEASILLLLLRERAGLVESRDRRLIEFGHPSLQDTTRV